MITGKNQAGTQKQKRAWDVDGIDVQTKSDWIQFMYTHLCISMHIYACICFFPRQVLRLFACGQRCQNKINFDWPQPEQIKLKYRSFEFYLYILFHFISADLLFL